MHIVDVTNATDPQVVGVYNDPNTQVLDVKYLEYNGNEYVILQINSLTPDMQIQMSENGATQFKYPLH